MKRKITGARQKHIVGYKIANAKGQYLAGFNSDELSMTFKIQTWWEDEPSFACKFLEFYQASCVSQLLTCTNRVITVVKYYDEDGED